MQEAEANSEIFNLNSGEIESLSPEQIKQAQQIGEVALENMVRVEVPEKHFLADYAEQIKSLVSGHDEDIDSIMHAISGQALRDSSEPFSIFITGPEGSGKTETAQAMADVLADGECMKIDCSKFKGMVDPSVAIVQEFADGEGTLTVPGGGEDGSPAIIVFENIEEADDTFINYLASGPMNEGKFTLTVPQQGVYSLGIENAIYVFTSRLGTGTEESAVGFKTDSTEDAAGRKTKQDIKKSADNYIKVFGERFLDSIDQRVYYEALSDEDLGDVLDGYVGSRDTYEKYGMGVELSEDVRDEIVRSVPQNKRNATTVVRQYQRLVEPDISRLAGGGKVPANHEVFVGKNEDNEYEYYIRLDPSKIVEELNIVRQSLNPLMEREEELVQILEDQGIGLDTQGNPTLEY